MFPRHNACADEQMGFRNLGGWTYYYCSDEAWTHVVVLWEVFSKRIFVDIIGVGVNRDMSISLSMCRFFNVLITNAAEVISFVLHLVFSLTNLSFKGVAQKQFEN
jgi:hypothetical protein